MNFPEQQDDRWQSPKSRSKISKVIRENIDRFDLDLTGLTVLTEAAGDSYFVTPIIAATAGAQVYARAKDSPYGSKEDIARFVAKKAGDFSLENCIEVLYELPGKIIEKCNVVTNLGMLRPIDADFIRKMNKDAVITSFCEDWEVREKDIDLEKCRNRGIVAAAVNESSSYRDIFRYVGYLALKLIMETDLEILYNRFLVISSDKFGQTVSDVLRLNGSDVNLVDPHEFEKNRLSLSDYQGVIVADYSYQAPLVSAAGLIKPSELESFSPHCLIVHLAGDVDAQELKKHGIQCHPDRQGYPAKMSRTLEYLGIRPLIELHTAGLKVGEILSKERAKGASIEDIHRKFAQHPLCQLML